MKNTNAWQIPYPESGDHTRTWEYWQAIADRVDACLTQLQTRTVQVAADGTNTMNFSNTTPVAQTPIVGVAFTGPPSGKVLLICHATTRNRTANFYTYSAAQVRTGLTLNAGTMVLDPTVEPAAKLSIYVLGIAEGSCIQSLNVTPGAPYNAVCVGWCDSGTSGDQYNRRIEVVCL